MTLTDTDVRITSRDFYFDDPHATYRRLREESPVFWHEGGGFWALTRYADIEQVSKDAESFSVASGVLLTDVLKEHDYLSKMFPEGSENFSVVDPPRHGELRHILNFAFTRTRINSFEPKIRQLVTQCLDAIGDGETVDVVQALSIPVTANVIKAFIDCEDMTVKQVVEWSDDVFRMGSDISMEELKETVERIKPMFSFFMNKVEEHRKNPKDDFIGKLIDAELDDAKLTTMMIEVYLQTVMVAGNETTRNGFSASIRMFADFPNQYARLRDRPELVPSAVEEILRYHNPTIGFLRTATRDTEVGGQKIAKGEKVYLIYGAANRDPAIFPDSEKFDITRFVDTTKTHLTFGRGPHICIGMALARLEMRILLEELIKRFCGFDLSGNPVYPDTLLGNGYLRLPARFKRDKS